MAMLHGGAKLSSNAKLGSQIQTVSLMPVRSCSQLWRSRAATPRAMMQRLRLSRLWHALPRCYSHEHACCMQHREWSARPCSSPHSSVPPSMLRVCTVQPPFALLGRQLRQGQVSSLPCKHACYQPQLEHPKEVEIHACVVGAQCASCACSALQSIPCDGI